ncbi:MAG: isoprenylcysteine carboxylmethyltransferase family protein [Myxococcales bacterium]|nr:isoprenylcysteine carboxylmethyltransferase family protein [Myxococcales bacterium]MCB9713598.1 isoprenylcysteine carboxylmethyltransferase family protein [Myxococcales bacterium]
MTPELRRAVVQRSVQILVLDAIWLVLFLVAAGTVRVWAAWAYLGLGVALAVVNFLVVAPRNPEVIVARSRGAQKGTKGFETWFGLVFGIAFLALPVVAGLDAVRFGWSHLPEWLVWVGLGVVVLGNVPIVAAMVVNPHLEKTVRIQEDRGHRVIDTGAYAIVRHPMYVGTLLQQLAVPLVLGSAWAFVPAAVVLAAMVGRTALEDRTLRAELPGYEEYTKRTRARLLPGIW